MGVGALLKSVWGNPLSLGVDLDGPESVLARHRIVTSSPLLRAHYESWYEEFLVPYRETARIDGKIVEIGCGPGFLDETIPGLIKTDCVPNPLADKIMDGMALDFPDESLRAVFLVGVLHHMLEPGKFLAEAQRCLKPGGRLMLLEPNSSNIYLRPLMKCLDHYEYFDDEAAEWRNTSASPMTNANLSLPANIFFRDHERFRRAFPALRIRGVRYHTFLLYLVTGGMAYRPFLPSFCAPLLRAIDRAAAPLMKSLGHMMTVDIVKDPHP